jgi:hypothetical protein
VFHFATRFIQLKRVFVFPMEQASGPSVAVAIIPLSLRRMIFS